MSIRAVAEESRARAASTKDAATSLRQRSTKLWGTTADERAHARPDIHLEPNPSPPPHISNLNPLPASTPDPDPAHPPAPFKWIRGEHLHGNVFLAMNTTTGEMIAAKQVPTHAHDGRANARELDALKSTAQAMKDLDHPNIVQYLGLEETPSVCSLFTEYVPGGSLEQLLQTHGRPSANTAKAFCVQILDGLAYLHARGIVHRDLRAAHILLDPAGTCKVSHIGASGPPGAGTSALAFLAAAQSAVFWMAPAVIRSGGRTYGAHTDMWSLGCVVLELWTGERPWGGEEALDVVVKVFSGECPPIPPVPPSENFLCKCFSAAVDASGFASELRGHAYLELPPDWSFRGFV
ncbi:kinase-like domain-containing protein [Amylostereum chailletii]|nr:kinase-like domain-containing protein [Amylostereum chailletii]